MHRSQQYEILMPVVRSVMPDTVRENISPNTKADEGLTPPKKPVTSYRILAAFESVFGGDNVDKSKKDSVESVPVATFIEFIKANLSKKWVIPVEAYIAGGCMPDDGNRKKDSGNTINVALVDEESIHRCVAVLLPLSVQQVSPQKSGPNSVSRKRVLTLDRTRLE